MKQKDDYLWKGILEDVFDDFLRFLHPDADKVFDLDRGITFLDKELEQLFPPEDDEFAPKVEQLIEQRFARLLERRAVELPQLLRMGFVLAA